MQTIIETLNPTATVNIHYGSFQAAVQYALDNDYAIVNRSSTGLADNDNTAGLDMLDNDGICVHSNGVNSYVENTDITSLDAIITARWTSGAYGVSSEFTMVEYDNNSYNVAYLTGKMAEYGIAHPALSYTTIRQAIRDNASNGGTWEAITGYGTPDWDATETALALL